MVKILSLQSKWFRLSDSEKILVSLILQITNDGIPLELFKNQTVTVWKYGPWHRAAFYQDELYPCLSGSV